jgi:hypothetical protein
MKRRPKHDKNVRKLKRKSSIFKRNSAMQFKDRDNKIVKQTMDGDTFVFED